MGLTQRAYAAHRKDRGLRGSTLKAVQDALTAGRIVRGADGKIDPADADRLWLERTDASKQQAMGSQRRQVRAVAAASSLESHEIAPRHSSAGTAEGQTYFEAQRQREWLKLDQDKLALNEKIGKLVEIGPINAWAAGMILKAREELLRIAPELRDRLAQESDPIACERLLAGRIYQALQSLSAYEPI